MKKKVRGLEEDFMKSLSFFFSLNYIVSGNVVFYKYL